MGKGLEELSVTDWMTIYWRAGAASAVFALLGGFLGAVLWTIFTKLGGEL